MSDGLGAGGTPLSRRRVLKITAIAGVGGVLGGGLLSELIRQGRLHRVSSTRAGLGTLITITTADSDPRRARSSIDRAFARIESLESLLSRHRPGTPVSRLNRDGVLLRAPEELTKVVAEAQSLSARTDGAFDITMAPLLDLYATRHARGRLPTPEEIARTRDSVGYEHLLVDGDRLEFGMPAMSITLDGIAKGYVVDRVVEDLVAGGYANVLVDAGGDLGSHGVGRSEWNVAVQDPRDPASVAGIVSLRDGACIATSGDYMQAYTADRSAHPVIDPRTGISPVLASSATVVSASVMTSDSLSTATLVMGPDAGVELLESVDGVEGLIIGKDGTRRATGGW